MDRRSIYSAHVYEPSSGENRDARLQLQTQLETFILDFRLDNNFVYRDQLRENALLKRYYCDVNINDLIAFNEELAHQLTSEPAEVIPLFEYALMKCTYRIVFPHEPKVDIPKHQLLLHSNADDVSIRNLDSMAIARLVRVPGIVIGASVISSKATELHIQCQNCGHTKAIPILGGFTGQIIKLQEAPDQVPVGELPRYVLISADRYLTNRVVPGSRCTVMGIFSIYQNKASKNSSNGGAVAIRTPYLRAVGIQSDIDQAAKGNATFSEEEEQEFLELSRRSDIYNVMAACIAPLIYGHRDIKKLILCLLLGGSKKILPDGMKLRGDINVLLLGDPVLAAANPIFGRYDDMKTPGENIDFQTTILLRFDMIFIVKDDHSREKDEKMAKHVLGIQMNGRGADELVESEIPIDKMRRYITYCKTRCAP
ncbi:hypothetical protein FOMA001_g11765 [Fusarium oxysporum f. sp. matthiolae]|nr:hypothetical protein FOMA001_g11765 [Fusarium oxysporum f. sp. matthiolae]